MSAKDEYIKLAREKAKKDYIKHPKIFLKGVTNHYSQHVDVYMYDEYESVRMDIIKELRELNNGTN